MMAFLEKVQAKTINPRILQQGVNNITIKFDNVPLTPGKVYKITLIISQGVKIFQVDMNVECKEEQA